jgi:hypothetical protein
MSQQFISRVINYVANEILIKGLANSKTFQRFAVQTDKKMKDIHKTHIEKLTNEFSNVVDGSVKNQSRSASMQAGPPQPPRGGFVGFLSAFAKEVRKDLGISK